MSLPLRPPGGLGVLLGQVTAIQALSTLSVLALATVAPTAAASLGVGAELVGYQVSLVYAAAAVVSAMAGAAVRRLGAGSSSIAAVAFGLLGIAGVSFAGIWGIAAASLLLGAGYGLTNPAASHLLNRFAPPGRRNLVFSLKQTGVPLGGVIAGVMLPTLSEAAGWRGGMLVIAGLFAAMLVLLLPVRRAWDIDRVPDGSVWAGWGEGPRLIWTHAALRGYALMGFCYSAIQLSLMAFCVNLLVHDLGWLLVTAGVTAAVVQATGAIGRVAWGVLGDYTHKGGAVLVAIGAVSSLSGLAMAWITPTWPAPAIIGLLALLGASAIGWNGVFLAEVARVAPPGAVGAATGGALMLTFAGVVAGPALSSMIFSVLGSYAQTLAAMAAFPAAGTLIVYFMKDRPQHVRISFLPRRRVR